MWQFHNKNNFVNLIKTAEFKQMQKIKSITPTWEETLRPTWQTMQNIHINNE